MHKLWRYLPGFLIGAAIVLVIGWASGLLPAYINYCYENQSGQKECTTHHIALIALWEIRKFLNWIASAITNWIAPAITAFATAAIAYFTLTLKRSTDNLWGVTDRTLKASERNLEAIERAYIFHGYTPLQFRNNQARFTLIMINAGRMPALVKEIGYKFLARTDLPKIREKIDWTWETLEYDFIVRPNQSANIGQCLSLETDHTFVTYIKYQDMFTKRMHTSWMGMYIYPNRREGQQSERAGGDTWNDWD
jgi:hypothetical protein